MSTVPIGEWHDYRRDDTRMGVQELPRRSNPGEPMRERWSVRLGGSYQEIVPVEDGSGDLLMADGGGIQRLSSNGEFRWRTKPFGAHWITGVFDLDGNGQFEILTSNGREVVILSAETGEIQFRDTVGPPRSYGTYATMFNVHSFLGDGMQILVPCFSSKEVYFYDCSGDARTTRLRHKLWMDDSYHPTIAIGDVNGDGVDEIVIARIGGVYVFDPASGKMISETIWKSDEERRRNYGHFELADVNGDGKLEAIILSDRVSRHIAVLGNDGNGNFQPLWDRFIEHIYPNDTTELRYTANSIGDFDGDGKREIAISIFNERKDGRWYTELLHSETGERILELPDFYLRGAQDANGDGLPELCLSRETTRQPREYSPLSIYSCKKSKELWSVSEGHFAERTVGSIGRNCEFKPEIFGSHEIWNAECNGITGVFLQSPEMGLQILDKDFQLHTLSFATDKGHQTDRIAHISQDALYITPAAGSLVKLTPHGPQHFLSCGYHLSTEAHIAARPGNTPTVAEWNGARYLAVPDFANSIHIFRTRGSDAPELIANVTGRSRLGYDNVFHAASIIVTRHGPRLVIVDDEAFTHSRLSLYSLTGQRVKSFEFHDMPPSKPGNRIGCYDWLYFEHSRGEALLVSFYQSQSMNSESSLALLLDTGEILWRNSHTGEGEFGRGVGPWGTSALFRIEGTPVAAFCAKDTLCFLELETGQFLSEPKLLTDFTAEEMKREHRLKEQSLSTTSSVDDPFTAYGTPVVCGNETVIGGCLGGFGILPSSFMLHPSTVPKWWHIASFGDVLYRLPGIGDVDGDGKLELAQGHADGTLRICDFESGNLRAKIDLNAIATDVLTLDVNGDGRMEFVFGTNDGRLITVGSNAGNFTIVDQMETGAALGSPIAADFDGDGSAEIYVVTGDGHLRCFY